MTPNRPNPYESPPPLGSFGQRSWSQRLLIATLLVLFIPYTLLAGLLAAMMIGAPLAQLSGERLGWFAGSFAAMATMAWAIFRYAQVLRALLRSHH
jgi:hypothetical protein